jgi:putative hydrolase of the HAD superfamily
MSTQGKKAVFFDLDETLVDRRAGVVHFARRLWQENIVRARDEAEFLQTLIKVDDNGRTSGLERFTALCENHLPDTDPHDLLKRFRREAWLEITLLPGAIQTLKTLTERGYRIGIVSNGSSATQRAKIRNSALRAWDDVAVISGELDCKKPDPFIYQHAMKMLGVTAAESWFVGDCPINDVLGPATQGMSPIWVERHVGWPMQHTSAYVARVTHVEEALDVIQ